MSQSSYNSQILATQAAAWIKGDGTTSFPIGCSITKMPSSTGVYVLTLPTGEGVVDVQSFTRAQVKGTVGASAVVEDNDEYTKTIRVFAASGSGALDADIEVVVERSTINL